ncbi:glycosyltransferase [Microbulbifer sp. SSSA005]|uniref:glycosyltransferase n=1 Tax=Microbulbifer sp. SSSA005 TaxID=3243378 RepID=UPI00403A5FBF
MVCFTEVKLKVVQFLPSLEPGITATLALEFANELVKKGHESLVISTDGPLEARFRLHGSDFISFPKISESIWSLRHKSRLRKILAGLQPDIVHTYGRSTAFLAWHALKSESVATRPKLVPLVDQYFSNSYFNKGLLAGDGVIATSYGIAKYLKNASIKFSENPIEVIYRGINVREFDREKPVASQWQLKLLNSYPQLEGKNWWLMPSEISANGGQEEFLHMLAQAAVQRDDVHGVVVGALVENDLRYLKKLEGLAQGLGLGGRVTFLGERQDMRELYATSQLVFHLASEKNESAKYSREALAMGRPVIAYSDGCTGEVLEKYFPDGLVQRGNMKSLIEKSLGLVNRPNSLNPEEFSYSASAEKAIVFFQKLLN